MIRYAFGILTHAQPAALARLITALDDPAHLFVVHVDAKADIAAFRDVVAALPNVVFVEQRVGVNYGGFSMVEATLRVIDTAFSVAPDLARLTLLSGVSYPVFGPARLREWLDSPQEHIGYRRTKPDGRHAPRIRRVHMIDHPLLNPRRPAPEQVPAWEASRQYVQGFLDGLPDAPRLPIPYCVGSQWWSLTAPALRYIRERMARQAGLVERFRQSFIPDESFFQSFIADSEFDARRSQATHFVDWSEKGRKRGLNLDEDDFRRIVDSGYPFTRKVDPDRSGALADRLDLWRASPEGDG